MTGSAHRYGLVLLARSDPRLLRATLASVEGLHDPPELVTIVVPGGREHLFESLNAERSHTFGFEVVITDAQDESELGVGFNAVASRCDIVVLAPEGVVFDADYLDAIRDRAERWEDRVGGIDLVNRVVRLDADASDADAAIAAPRESPLKPMLRRWLRARSLMPGVLWARVAACGNIRFLSLPDTCDVMSCVAFLDRLRPRGRTELRFSDRARSIRVVPERRSGFDVGYSVYGKLEQLAERDSAGRLSPNAGPSHLDPRLEKLRLIGGQALQLVLVPESRRYVRTFLKGALAARRAGKAVRQTVHRDLRELG